MNQLSTRKKIGYGIGDLGGNLFFTIMGFYLLFYFTDVAGIAAGLAGTAIMIGKIWDAVTDPTVGYLSDRSKSRWGRRRPFMFAGAIILFFGMGILFIPYGVTSQIALFVLATLTYCLVNTAYTLVNIPYGALTPELTDDYYERTVLNGFRMSFAVVGTFVGVSIVLPLVDLFGGTRLAWTGMGLVTGGIMAAATLTVVFSVRENPKPRIHSQENIFKSYFQVLSMKTFLTALIPWALHMAGVNVLQTSLLYYFRYIYQNEAAFQIALPILLGAAVLAIPVWVRISKQIGKKLSYNIGMLIFAAGVILFFFIGHRTGVQVSYVIMFFAGLGFATHYVMPWAIVPDVVEYDYAERGVRREGVFYGMWTFSSKIGQAVGIGLSGWMLSIFGYQESVAGVQAATQSETAMLGIRLLTGPIPAAFFIAGVIVLSFFPITNKKYQEIMKRVEQMEKKAEIREYPD
ncbi:MAG: MFS transporter [Spirochaetaceae bacterium]|nr:MFS transporter [Spirochaetaceae bacterium]MCF7947141.1 MFS transporter [Spirochaetia bacterium]MCF7950006.1 MFS transporter [Spirochaetaceae bacterium]